MGIVAGPIHRLLVEDHRRLDALLERATAEPERINLTAYAAFRGGLLKHIGMEEKILLPAVQRLRGGEPLPIAALLVPTPTLGVIATLRVVLSIHNPLEEDADGMYESCERVLGNQVDGLLAELHRAPELPAASHVDGAGVLGATRRALVWAGLEVEALPLIRQE